MLQHLCRGSGVLSQEGLGFRAPGEHRAGSPSHVTLVRRRHFTPHQRWSDGPVFAFVLCAVRS